MFELIAFLAITLVFARAVAGPSHGHVLPISVLFAWTIFAILTYLLNHYLPYAGGGDDEDYFALAIVPVTSLSQLADLGRFSEAMEQPGYPIILSALNYVFDLDLYGLKLFNLLVFILNALIWYQIGTELKGRSFALRLYFVQLLMAPLWFYFLFLRKDLLIVFAQSSLLLALMVTLRKNSLFAWCAIVICNLLLVMLRTPLLAQSLVLILCTLLFASSASLGGRFLRLGGGIGITAALFLVVSNPDIMNAFGVSAGHRVLGSDEMSSSFLDESATANGPGVIFPIIYMLSEVTVLSVQAWREFDSAFIRGVLALPWIVLVVPYGIYGVLSLLCYMTRKNAVDGRIASTHVEAISNRPWILLLIYVFTYLLISFKSGDTTRWRTPDIPAWGALALLGFQMMKPKSRIDTLMSWGIVLIFVFIYLSYAKQ